MPKRPPSSLSRQSSSLNDPLEERVRGRVVRATRAIARRDQATPGARPADGGGPSLELRALRLVYCTMSRVHRLYREQTGQRVTPALRAAAQAFKREPSVHSLAPVAGHLDEMGLLTW